MNRTPVPKELAASTGPTATQKQLDYLRDLIEKKNIDHPEAKLTDEQRRWLKQPQPEEFWVDETTRLSKSKASAMIGLLVELPKLVQTKDEIKATIDMPDVPDGRYAVEKDDGTLMFYSVKKGRSVTFVDVWASDARWPIKNAVEKRRILELIALDPKTAMNRFGQEIGRCGRCGRTLTRKDSRMRGLGPDCASMMASGFGW